MRIGELAAECRCPVETIRYYEKIGLLPLPLRQANGYRCYDDTHRKWLQFILRSRALGFSQEQVRRLTDLAHQRQPVCAEVLELMEAQVEEVRAKARMLGRMERALGRLKEKCRDGTLHECPVIDELMR